MSEKSSNPSDLSIDSLSLPEDFPSDSNDQLNNDNSINMEPLNTKKKRRKKKKKNPNNSPSLSSSSVTLSNSSSRKAKKDVRKEKEELIEGEEDEEEVVVLEESAVGPEELHRACWKGDLELIRKLLKVKKGREQLNQRDRHGNPPLHIALHLRHKDIISYLLSEGADPTAKNGGGWNSLQEAVASAERETAMQIYMASMQEMQRRFYTRVPKLMDAVEHIPNFYMELQWEFRSWVPLVSRFCPSDKYRIWKQGSNLRADTTLVGFQNFRWIRGNVSIVFSGRDAAQPGTIVSINHDKKTLEFFNNFRWKTRKAIERDINVVFCRTLLKIDMQMDGVVFNPPPRGWFGSSSNSETVGAWKGEKMEVSGFKYITKHRTDTTKQKDQPRTPRDEAPAVSFEEYFEEELAKDIGKGKGLLYASEKYREKVREFKGNVWFSKEFPLSIEEVMPVIELLTPTGKHFQKLKQFVELKMPPEAGFPVKIEIPVFPTIVGTISFLHFEEKNDFEPNFFNVPMDYVIVV